MAGERYCIIVKLRGREEWIEHIEFFSLTDANHCAQMLRKSFKEIEDCMAVPKDPSGLRSCEGST